MARKSNQRGTVEFHRGNWTVRYRERDWSTRKLTPKRHTLEGCMDEESALSAAKEFMRAVNEQTSNPAAKINAPIVKTFKDFVNGDWSEYCIARKHTPSTSDTYGSLLKVHLVPFFRDKELGQITPADITKFFNYYRQEHPHRSPAMLYRLLKVMFQVAVEYDLIDKSPVRPKRHLPDIEPMKKASLQPGTIRQIIDVLSDDLRLFLMVMSITGVRLNECRAFRWLNFDEVAGEISVTHSLYRNKLKSPKTKASRKTIPLPEVMVRLLASHRNRSSFPRAEDFIFADSTGLPITAYRLYRKLYAAMKSVGLPREKGKFGFHIFRHSAGSILYEVTRDLKLVQKALRHSNMQTTVNIYVHPSDAVAREATEILARQILPDQNPNCDPDVTQKERRVS